MYRDTAHFSGLYKFTALAGILFCGLANAATYYVDGTVAASGNGTSWATAWKNFSNITGLDGDDIVDVNTGSYTAVSLTNIDGTSGHPNIIRAATGKNPTCNKVTLTNCDHLIWDGIDSLVTQAYGTKGVYIDGCTDVNIVDTSVIPASVYTPASDTSGIYINNSTAININTCEITSWESGINIIGTSSAIIYKSKVHNTRSFGISISSHNVKIDSSEIYEWGSRHSASRGIRTVSAVFPTEGYSGIEIVNSIIMSGATGMRTAVALSDCNSVVITNNTIVNRYIEDATNKALWHGTAIYLNKSTGSSGVGIIIRNNILAGNLYSTYSATMDAITKTDNIVYSILAQTYKTVSSDSLLVMSGANTIKDVNIANTTYFNNNSLCFITGTGTAIGPNNLIPMGNSFSINAAYSASAPVLDIYGTTRSTPDIGAIEYTSPTLLNPSSTSTCQNLGGVRLQWEEMTGSSYSVYFGINNPPVTCIATTSDTYLDINDVESGTTYYWRVKSLYSDYSPTWSFSTKQVVYVDENASGGSKNGTSWQNAYTNLQDALTSADSCKEIWVAKGLYKPIVTTNNPAGGADRRATFAMKDGVKIYGGFNGNERFQYQRDCNSNQSILSGEIDNGDDYALDFDGIDDYVQLSSGFSDFTNGLTVMLWVYPTGAKPLARFIDFGNGPASDNIIFAWSGSSSSLKIEVFNDATSGGAVESSTNAIDIGLWQHFVATIDASGNAKIYKNGAIIASGTIAVPRNLTRTINYIGKSNWSPRPYYNGKLDEVMILNRCVSSTEIEKIYADGSGDKKISGIDSLNVNVYPIAYWRFNEGTGSSVQDSIGNSNGTIAGGAKWLAGELNLKAGNSYNVITACGVDSSTLVDGFTITNGITGVYCNGTSAVINNCDIADNNDGVVCNPSDTATITNNRIYDNLGNGICTTMAQPIIHNNCIYNNSVGVVCTADTSQSMSYNTIVGNYSYGIISKGCLAPTITNSILWENNDDLNGCTATYSCIKNGDSGTGNISTNPLFVNAANYDFHLFDYSPCVDAGSTALKDMGAYGNTLADITKSTDSDSDGLPDSWEMVYFGNLNQTGSGNFDSDGLTNLTEYQIGTSPNSVDTDGDGMPDGWEVQYGLNPLDPSDTHQDRDNDGKDNLREYTTGSNPTASDIVTVPTNYSTIQAAINACGQDGDIVEIESGTYQGSDNRDLDFGGKKIIVRSKNTSNPAVIDCQGSQSVPHRAFRFHSGETSESVISNLKIKNGYGLQSGSDYVGGAILCENNSNPMIENCQFITNSASKGSVIYNDASSPTIIGCVFQNNTSTASGAAIYNKGVSHPVVESSILVGNTSSGNGGAVYNESSSSPTFINCTISDNTSQSGHGGGLYNEPGGDPIVTNCILWSNVVSTGNQLQKQICGSSPKVTFSCLQDDSQGDGKIPFTGNNGIIYGNPSWLQGETNSGIDFDRSKKTYVEVPDNGNLEGMSGLTITMWVKPETLSNYDALICKGTWGEGFAAHTGASGDIWWGTSCDAGGRVNKNSAILTTGVWQFITLTFKGGSYWRIYKNGILQAETATTVSTIPSANIVNLTIGGTLLNINYFDGSIDEVMIFNEALDATNTDKINYIYSNGLTGFSGPQPISYWNFDEGNGNIACDSINRGATNIDTKPEFKIQLGTAVNFNGTSDCIDIPIDVSETSYAVSLWFKTLNGSYDNCGIYSVRGVATSSDRHIYLSGGNVKARVWNDETITTSGIDYADGQWHHVVHTFGGVQGVQKIYIDGTLRATGTKTSSDFTCHDRISIGYSIDASSDYFTGEIGDVVIFDKALTADEISLIYSNGRKLGDVKKYYSLTTNSPCIDRGDNYAVDANSLDVLCGSRILANKYNGEPKVDMGACEYTGIISNRAPQLTTIGNQKIVESDEIRITLRSTDPDGDTVHYSALNMPFGAVIEGDIFIWTPTVQQAGTSVSGTAYAVTFKVSDGELEDSETISITAQPEKLAADWKLDETSGTTADDAVGGHDGTVNGATWTTNGVVNGALSFDGSNDYVQITNMNGAYYSFSFWAKFLGTGSYERVFDFGGTGSQILYLSRYSTYDNLYLNVGGQSTYSDAGIVINNQWHQYTVVVVSEGASSWRVLFYRDGMQYGAAKSISQLPSDQTQTPRNTCFIGRNSTASNSYFTGLLDELRIYDRSLNEYEVQKIVTNIHLPVLTDIGNKTVETGNLLSFAVNAFDADGDDLAFSATGFPTGALFENGTFSWIPSSTGTYQVTFTADDGEYDDTETITISVVSSTGTPQGAAKAVSGSLGNDLKLSVDPFTGSVSYTVPIVIPPARQNTQPNVALAYSGGGNGWCGVGWNLGMGAIQRDTKNGVPVNGARDGYDDTKGFVVSFSTVNSKLSLVNAGTNEYRAETDQAFLKYIYDAAQNIWIATDKSGNKFYFGAITGESTETVGARMNHPLFTTNSTFMWALAKIVDISGNTTYFDYVDPTTSGYQLYLQRIRYNGNINSPAISATHKVEFVLEDRPDKSISLATGYRIETAKRLSEIVVKVSDTLVSRYKLCYKLSPTSRRSLLKSVIEYGNDDKTALSPLEFEYQEYAFEFGTAQSWGPLDARGYTGNDNNGKIWNSPAANEVVSGSSNTLIELLDIDGDGLPDRVMRNASSPYTNFKVQLNTGDGFETDTSGNPITRNWGTVSTQGNDSDSTWGSVQSLLNNEAKVMLGDIDGDCLPDRILRNNVTNFVSPQNVFKIQLNTGFGFSDTILSWSGIDYQGQSTSLGWNSPHASNSSSETYVTMLDINGDGRPDRVMRNNVSNFASPANVFKVQLNNGAGFDNAITWGPVDAQLQTTSTAWNSPISRDTGGDTYVCLMDINGDGLPDRVMRKYSSLFNVFKVQFNTGYGFETNSSGNPVISDWGPVMTQGDTTAGYGSPQTIDTSTSDAQTMIFDITADGLPDRVMRNNVSSFTSPENVFKVQVNTGSGFENGTRNWKNIDGQGATTAEWFSPYGDDTLGTQCMLFDINGDGLPDRVMRKSSGDFVAPNNVLKVQLNKGPVPDLLKKVRGRLGGYAEVAYTPSTQYDNKDNVGKNMLPFPIQTATTMTVNDGLGTESAITYKYSHGYYDKQRKEFMGFGCSEVTDPCGAKTVTYYHQGGGYDDTPNGEFEDQGAFAKKGSPYCTEAYGSDGKLYSRTISKVVQQQVQSGKNWYFAYIAQTISMNYEGTDQYRAKAQQAEYDIAKGNILKAIDFGEVTNVDIKHHTFTDLTQYSDGRYDYTTYVHTQYETFTNTDIQAKIDRTWTSSDYAGSVILKDTEFTYDTYGRLLTERSWIDTKSRWTATSSYGYDQYGNQTNATDKAGIPTITEFDTTYQMFPVKTTTGNGTAQDKFVTEATYDVRSGLVLTTKDAMGIKSQNFYDPLYRLTDVKVGTQPDGDPTLLVTNIEYCIGGIIDGEISNNFIRQRFSGYEAYAYNDGLGRVIQSRTKAETGAEADYRAVDVCYDICGRNSFTTETFFSSGSAFTTWDITRPGVFTDYDAVGRVAVITTSDDDIGSPMGTASKEYIDNGNPWADVSIDPLGKVTKRHFDAAGNVIELIEVTDTGDITTTYYYDQLHRLTATVDNLDRTVTSATYDSLDRKVQTSDIDMGIWTYDYDDAGRLIEQIDSRSNQVKLYYEDTKIGRLSSKEVYNNSNPRVLVETITYTYDTSDDPTNYTVYKGLLYKVVDGAGWEKTSYDTRGRAVKSTRYITEKSHEYTTATEYDDAGRVTMVYYPDSSATIQYEYGTASELQTVTKLSGTQEVLYQTNGFYVDGKLKKATYGNGVSTDYQYYEHSRRLKNIHTYKGTSELQNLSYTFDKASNISSITDNVYIGTASSTIKDIQYDDLYRLTSLNSTGQGKTVAFSYDSTGNIVTNGDLGTGAYQYSGSGHTHSQPHAVTSVSGLSGYSYSYDNCGNMTTRKNQTLTYDPQNRLTRVQATGLDMQYTYSHSGSRLYKKNVTSGVVTGLWIGGIYEEKYDASRGRTLALCHVIANGETIVTYEPRYQSQLVRLFFERAPYMEKAVDGISTASIAIFGGGRFPITALTICLLVGAGFGFAESRGRLTRYMRLYGPVHKFFYSQNPWKQIIIMALFASTLLYVVPQDASAASPVYDPVFYYYHSDHLGSSSVMTDHAGTVVQQYGYTAFGKERYKNNTSAFNVTSRYTGQKLDDDSGLYFYNSRYYDPEIGRFIQSDSIVPSSDTSQALNRYAYVKNNPLKFTDPSGHGWFSKFIKKNIGTIIMVALIIAFPGAGVLAMMAFGAISSAVSTAVNGGNLKSFLIGAAISIASAGIASAIGGAAIGGAAWEGMSYNLIGGAIQGAIIGSISGAISSAVYGGNTLDNMGDGALSGSISGAAVGGAKQYRGGITAGAMVVAKSTQQIVNAIGKFGFAVLTDVAKLLVLNIVSVPFDHWVPATTGGLYIPQGLKNLIERTMPRGEAARIDALNGMHGWHGATNAAMASQYGPIGAALSWVGGILHECADPLGMSAEIGAQGVLNWVIDSTGDIAANTLGCVGGILNPLSSDKAISAGRSLGSLVPGPADPWLENNVGYNGNPSDGWKAKSHGL